ncbi:hypothetical protein Emag_001106 [Eimeria magna]
MGGAAMQQPSLLLLLLLLLPPWSVSAIFLKLNSRGFAEAPGGPLRGPSLLFLGLSPRSKSSGWRQFQRAAAGACSSTASALAPAASAAAAAAAAPAAAAAAAAAAEEGSLRNVAIVAHVDHGKTTLVDALLAYAAEQQQQQQQHKKPVRPEGKEGVTW